MLGYQAQLMRCINQGGSNNVTTKKSIKSTFLNAELRVDAICLSRFQHFHRVFFELNPSLELPDSQFV